MKKVSIQYDLNAHIANISCEIKADTDKAIALISFDNLGYGVIAAIKFEATGFNSFGDTVLIQGNNKFYLVIQDVTINRNKSANNLKVILPNKDIRKLQLTEYQICFNDGSIVSYKGPNNKTVELECLSDKEGLGQKALASVRDIVSPYATYIPMDIDTGWICSCGRYNSSDTYTCSNCYANKDDVFAITDYTKLSEIIKAHQQNETKRHQEDEQKKIIQKKISVIRKVKICIAVIVGIVLLSLLSWRVVISSRTTYASEAEMRSDLQGTYTCYNNSSNKASAQIVIVGNTATIKLRGLQREFTGEIKWDYINGQIYLPWNPATKERVIVTKDKCLKSNKEVFERGGSMPSYSALNERWSKVLVVNIDSFVDGICKGTIKNTGMRTYSSLNVHCDFKNSQGDIITSDNCTISPYGLSPGESTEFKFSYSEKYNTYDKKRSIDKC